MFAFLAENLAPIMFASLIVVMLLGYPVAFALAFVGFAFGFVGIEMGLLPINLFGAIPDRIFGQMSNETLLAIPFFTFMGLILERSGMAEDLLDTIAQLFGPVRGGLAFAVIFVGAILAATTGVVAASVISMGLISLVPCRRIQLRQLQLLRPGPRSELTHEQSMTQTTGILPVVPRARDWNAQYPELAIGISSSENENDAIARNEPSAAYLNGKRGAPVKIMRRDASSDHCRRFQESWKCDGSRPEEDWIRFSWQRAGAEPLSD